jgi:membrane associated rhomboid family serine protease
LTEKIKTHSPANQNFMPVFTDLPEKKADLMVLILSSQGIETAVEKTEDNVFDVLVAGPDMAAARESVDAYTRENRFFRFKHPVKNFPISSFKSPTALVIMGVLWLVHLLSMGYHIHGAMILKYGASALFILQGETYRAITALFLHADARHLAGNMAGLLIFGAPVITLSGFGTGPFMLLFTGTMGNLMNAHLYQTAHLSIGASTAVMGAAGLLATYQIVARRTEGHKGKGRGEVMKKKPLHLNTLMPLFAGAILVGLLSQGERTDVMAHVLGFASGLASGIFFFPLNTVLAFHGKEALALVITLVILAASWLTPY